MMEAVRTQKHVLILPDRFAKAVRAVTTASERLRASMGRDPTIEELSAETNLKSFQIERVLAHKRSSKVSLEDSALDERTLHEMISGLSGAEAEPDGTYNKYVADEATVMLRSLLGNLTERERLVLEHRFGIGPSGEALCANAIAKLLGCVRSTVINTEGRALEKLRGLPEFLELEKALVSGGLVDYMEDMER